MIKFECAGKSDVGKRRSNNEDAIVLRPDLAFAALADGMGGAASGELASALLAETALQILSDQDQGTATSITDLVQRVFLFANQRIWKIARENPEHWGMGCTAELLAFEEDTYVVGHVGDSRTYLFKQECLRQITKDHSIIQEQIDNGLIKPENARTHSLRNVISRAVGIHEGLAVDLIQGKTQAGDIFLICSDGLTDMLEDSAITKILTETPGVEEAVHHLVESANLAGGLDNVSVVLCKII